MLRFSDTSWQSRPDYMSEFSASGWLPPELPFNMHPEENLSILS
jgi:hypothetical protein